MAESDDPLWAERGPSVDRAVLDQPLLLSAEPWDLSHPDARYYHQCRFTPRIVPARHVFSSCSCWSAPVVLWQPRLIGSVHEGRLAPRRANPGHPQVWGMGGALIEH